MIDKPATPDEVGRADSSLQHTEAYVTMHCNTANRICTANPGIALQSASPFSAFPLPVLSPALFEPVFSPFIGRKVGFLPLDGNVGDRLIDAAAEQLMRRFGVSYRRLNSRELQSGVPDAPLDAILVSGGGNMGATYPWPLLARRQALALGVAVTILPQSFTDTGEDTNGYARVFVRERASLKISPDFLLAPDLALGLHPPRVDEGAEAETGVWLRTDRESAVADHGLSLGDPISVSRSVVEYLGLAAKFEHVITDRLHFAIAGLLMGRQVTLLPNSYDKNRSMYDTWLRELGCHWRDTLEGVRFDRDRVSRGLWKRFVIAPSLALPWSARPERRSGWETVEAGSEIELRAESGTVIRCNRAAGFVWKLCDGRSTVEELCNILADGYRDGRLEVTRDFLETLRTLHDHGAIVLD
jgi:hypothetical protein